MGGDSANVNQNKPQPRPASPASQQSRRTPEARDKSETYESLGETFRQLTDKMETVTKDLKSDQIPYADDEDDYEDYLVTTEASDAKERERSKKRWINFRSSKSHNRSKSWLYM